MIGARISPAIEGNIEVRILDTMGEIYCGTMGVEILHIQNKPMRRWLIEKLESPRSRRIWSDDQKRRFQKDLIKAEEFERFLGFPAPLREVFDRHHGELLEPAFWLAGSRTSNTRRPSASAAKVQLSRIASSWGS